MVGVESDNRRRAEDPRRVRLVDKRRLCGRGVCCRIRVRAVGLCKKLQQQLRGRFDGGGGGQHNGPASRTGRGPPAGRRQSQRAESCLTGG
jgi:hypothetical protein